MSKQAKKLIILVVALLILVIGYFAITKIKDSKANVEEVSNDYVLCDITMDDIVTFTYDYEGETFSFEKDGEVWVDALDHSKNIAQYKITNMLNGIAPLKARDKVEGIDDLSSYGLDKPEVKVTFNTKDESYTFYGGPYFTLADGRFIYFEGEKTVYLIDSSIVSLFEKTWEDLVESAE